MTEFLPPDSSYVPDFYDDRGPAKYFHGRHRILGNFLKLLKKSVNEKGGSTFLIQGAPGAGKTALLINVRNWQKIMVGKLRLFIPLLFGIHKNYSNILAEGPNRKLLVCLEKLELMPS